MFIRVEVQKNHKLIVGCTFRTLLSVPAKSTSAILHEGDDGIN